jgi:hypothetical protein
MSDRKKFPAIPTAPIVGRPPELNIPDDLFDGCLSGEAYSSHPFTELDSFEDYAKDLRKAVRFNGRGDELFPDESQFLTELDNALLHYEMYRPIVTPEICGTLKEQRDYFEKLKRALKIKNPTSRLKKVQGRLKEITECDLDQRPRALCHLRRLLKAKLGYATFTQIAFASLDPEQGLEKKLINDFAQLNAAVDIVISDLTSKKPSQHAELYLLIEQLADMYEICSNTKPPKTVPTYEEEEEDKCEIKKKSKEKSAFFRLVKSIHPVVSFANKYPKTDSAIFEGIRLLK